METIYTTSWICYRYVTDPQSNAQPTESLRPALFTPHTQIRLLTHTSIDYYFFLVWHLLTHISLAYFLVWRLLTHIYALRHFWCGVSLVSFLVLCL